MDELVILTTTLKQISKIANQIISRALTVMRLITELENELVDEVVEENESITKEVALDRLRSITLGWIADAEIVVKEIPRFVTSGRAGKFKINDDSEVCPFLSQVWNGDTYDLTEVDGLVALRDDLARQLSEVTRERLIESAAK
jgi:hypothetical protein